MRMYYLEVCFMRSGAELTAELGKLQTTISNRLVLVCS
jgi:hypothetical protein